MGFFSKKRETMVSGLDTYFRSVPNVPTAQLEKMHEELRPYASEVSRCVLGDVFAGHASEIDVQGKKQKQRNTPLPNGSLYGCKTYGDAEKLNAAIVRELDERDSDD